MSILDTTIDLPTLEVDDRFRYNGDTQYLPISFFDAGGAHYAADIYSNGHDLEVVLFQGNDSHSYKSHPIEIMEWLYNSGQIPYYLQHGEMRLILTPYFVKWVPGDGFDMHEIPR